MKKKTALAAALFVLAPLGAPLAHHISMSFSDWQFEERKAFASFRLPLADAVWIMDPRLVIRQEASIQIRVPVDDALRDQVEAYLERAIPAKVELAGCTFLPGMEVSFEGGSVQARAELDCEPGYLDAIKLTSHFLVDENNLHTSLASLNFQGGVRQCLFRAGQYECGHHEAAIDAAPGWQAHVWPWWDYLALALLLLVCTRSTRVMVTALAAIALGHALAPASAIIGINAPAPDILRPALSALPVYAGMWVFAANNGRTRQVAAWLAAGHAALIVFAWSDFIRLSPLMAVGLGLVAAGPAGGAEENGETGEGISPSGLYVIAICWGMVHGFIVLWQKPLSMEWDGPIAMVLASAFAALALSWPVGKLLRKFQISGYIGLGLALLAVMVLALRSVNLPFSTFEYENARELLRNLVQSRQLDASFLTLALIMAAVIGGLHALTPGHGKTIVAAYLVGTRGRTLDAVILGLVVTLTHTSSVIILAVLALFASRYILPDQLVPWLSASSGLLILVLGIYLFQLRLRNYRRYGTVAPLPETMGHHHDDDHDHHHHDHDHHDHDHHHHHGGAVSHTHDGVTHTHVLPRPGVSLGSLVALGVTGGIVPCPDALAVLLIAVSLNRMVLGLLVIIAFSLGLAAVLIAIGIAMVKARPLVDRFAGQGRFTGLWLPLLSAGLVTVLGGLMLWKAWPW